MLQCWLACCYMASVTCAVHFMFSGEGSVEDGHTYNGTSTDLLFSLLLKFIQTRIISSFVVVKQITTCEVILFSPLCGRDRKNSRCPYLMRRWDQLHQKSLQPSKPTDGDPAISCCCHCMKPLEKGGDIPLRKYLKDALKRVRESWIREMRFNGRNILFFVPLCQNNYPLCWVNPSHIKNSDRVTWMPLRKKKMWEPHVTPV